MSDWSTCSMPASSAILHASRPFRGSRSKSYFVDDFLFFLSLFSFFYVRSLSFLALFLSFFLFLSVFLFFFLSFFDFLGLERNCSLRSKESLALLSSEELDDELELDDEEEEDDELLEESLSDELLRFLDFLWCFLFFFFLLLSFLRFPSPLIL